MNNEEIINAITVLRDVLKAAGLAYQKADEMLDDLKLNPVYPKAEIERAFCGKELSFDFGLVTTTAFLDDDVKELTKSEVLSSELLCKNCLKVFNK